MAIEIVSFPINSMVISHSYVNVYQRVLYFFWEGVVLKSFWTCNDFRNHTLKPATGGSDSGVLQQLKT